MGFFSNIFQATIKTVLVPVAVVKDVVEVAITGEASNTKDLLDSAKDNASEAMENLEEGNL